ncbi:MAG: LysM peptidoglycan-binding domain-containing protein [Anaerolineae bacterium]|nr:LysM peptidoglycan-binding domain-containing protein [Anaerolineae bacterium]
MARRALLVVVMLALAALACSRDVAEPVYTVTATPWLADPESGVAPTAQTSTGGSAGGAEPVADAGTPTPDPTAPASEGPTYVVQPNDTLLAIALLYNTNIPEMLTLNDLAAETDIYAGQALKVPGAPSQVGPSFKIIPDSELVYGPALKDFDTISYVARQPGYLAAHAEDVYGDVQTGAEIVQRIAEEYSVSPRLLLALLEYQSGWLTNPAPAEFEMYHPIGFIEGTTGCTSNCRGRRTASTKATTAGATGAFRRSCSPTARASRSRRRSTPAPPPCSTSSRRCRPRARGRRRWDRTASTPRL